MQPLKRDINCTILAILLPTSLGQTVPLVLSPLFFLLLFFLILPLFLPVISQLALPNFLLFHCWRTHFFFSLSLSLTSVVTYSLHSHHSLQSMTYFALLLMRVKKKKNTLFFSHTNTASQSVSCNFNFPPETYSVKFSVCVSRKKRNKRSKSAFYFGAFSLGTFFLPFHSSHPHKTHAEALNECV